MITFLSSLSRFIEAGLILSFAAVIGFLVACIIQIIDDFIARVNIQVYWDKVSEAEYNRALAEMRREERLRKKLEELIEESKNE